MMTMAIQGVDGFCVQLLARVNGVPSFQHGCGGLWKQLASQLCVLKCECQEEIGGGRCLCVNRDSEKDREKRGEEIESEGDEYV
jgi:hypothetical protein